MSQPKFKILSIDGGGIKGLYSLYVLEQFEAKFCKEGETLSDYFDLICGTSTGGIIALGIATGHKVSEIIKVYEDNAQKIFPQGTHTNFVSKSLASAWYMGCQLFGCKYSNQPLIDLANNFFGSTTMSQSKNLLCIPTHRLETDENVVFKYPHNGKTRDKNIKMADVALATSAAPTYFPPYFFSVNQVNDGKDTTYGGHFIDGGIWANNPTFVGIAEACRYFVGGHDKPYDSFDVLSIGNIKINVGDTHKKCWWKNMLHLDTYWNAFRFSNLINVIFSGSGKSTKFFSEVIGKFVNGTDNVTRVECIDYTSGSTVDGEVLLDNSNESFLKLLKSAGQKDGANYINDNSEVSKNANIQRFFEHKKTYIINQ